MKMNNRGFTLLEVTISLILFMALALGSAEVMPSVKAGNLKRLESSQAMLILERKMVEIRQECKREQKVLPATQTSATVPLRGGINGTLNVRVEAADGTGDPDALGGLKKVTLTITWTDKKNVFQTKRLVALIFCG